MGAVLVMEGEMALRRGDTLSLRYGLLVLDDDPDDAWVETQYGAFST